MRSNTEKLNIQEIDLGLVKDRLFANRFNRDDRPLETSIHHYGVKVLPSLLQRAEGYFVIDGWARIEICKRTGKEKIPCVIYNEEDLSLVEAFHLCMELNKWSREFNLVEKALCLKDAIQIFGGLKIPRSFWHVVGIKENVRNIHQYKELLKLPLSVQKYAVNNTIPLPIILVFLRFPQPQIEGLANQLFVLPLNQNKLAEILGLLLDISKREERLPLEIFDEIVKGIDPKYLGNAVQKEQMLRRFLHKRRNPHYEGKLKEFESRIKSLPLNDQTKINPSPFFEEDYVEINTKISSTQDIADLIALLKDDQWKIILGVDE